MHEQQQQVFSLLHVCLFIEVLRSIYELIWQIRLPYRDGLIDKSQPQFWG